MEVLQAKKMYMLKDLELKKNIMLLRNGKKNWDVPREKGVEQCEMKAVKKGGARSFMFQ